MYNIHPVLAALPFSLAFVLLILELMSIYKSDQRIDFCKNFILILLGIFILAAFFSGYYAQDNASLAFQVSNELIAYHHNIGRLSLFAVFPLCALRYACILSEQKIGFIISYRICLLLLFALVSYTGYLGADLVFKHGAGVLIQNN